MKKIISLRSKSYLVLFIILSTLLSFSGNFFALPKMFAETSYESVNAAVILNKQKSLDPVFESNPYLDVYTNEDGSKTAEVFSHPVKYQKIEDDHIFYEDINNDIIPIEKNTKNKLDANYALKNAANYFDVLFPSQFSQTQGMLLKVDDINIEIIPVLEDTAPPSKKAVVLQKGSRETMGIVGYESVFHPSASLKFTMLPNGYKKRLFFKNQLIKTNFLIF